MRKLGPNFIHFRNTYYHAMHRLYICAYLNNYNTEIYIIYIYVNKLFQLFFLKKQIYLQLHGTKNFIMLTVSVGNTCVFSMISGASAWKNGGCLEVTQWQGARVICILGQSHVWWLMSAIS